MSRKEFSITEQQEMCMHYYIAKGEDYHKFHFACMTFCKNDGTEIHSIQAIPIGSTVVYEDIQLDWLIEQGYDKLLGSKGPISWYG